MRTIHLPFLSRLFKYATQRRVIGWMKVYLQHGWWCTVPAERFSKFNISVWSVCHYALFLPSHPPPSSFLLFTPLRHCPSLSSPISSLLPPRQHSLRTFLLLCTVNVNALFSLSLPSHFFLFYSSYYSSPSLPLLISPPFISIISLSPFPRRFHPSSFP